MTAHGSQQPGRESATLKLSFLISEDESYFTFQKYLFIIIHETEATNIITVMPREEDTYAMLDTRDWSRVSHVTSAGRGKPVIGRVADPVSDYGLKSLDNDWHTVLMQHLSGS